MFNLKNIKIENKVSKEFSYSKGNVNLKFMLRTDTKTQLKDFKELLIVAQQEVEDEINK